MRDGRIRATWSNGEPRLHCTHAHALEMVVVVVVCVCVCV